MSAVRYFLTYTGNKLPLRLVNPLDEDELAHRNTYIRAEYDGQDRLIRCDKVVYGEVELTHRYRYYPDGRLSAAEIVIGDDRHVMIFPEDERAV